MVDRIYDLYNVLNDKNGTNNSSEALEAYQNLLVAMKQGASEKKLALQFVGKFCKNFPGEMTKTVEAAFDLCEDEDINVGERINLREKKTISRFRFANKRLKNFQHLFVHRLIHLHELLAYLLNYFKPMIQVK